MRIRRYDTNFSRRKFMADTARGVLATGVLMPLFDAVAATGDISKAYPDELLSIDAYTKGKIKTGDTIDASNVDVVKELLEPVRYLQIKTLGRKLKVGKTTTDIMKLSPWDYIHATLSNAGKAAMDSTGNVVNKADGKPWIGGAPFPRASAPREFWITQALSPSRHDAVFYAMKLTTVDADGSAAYDYTAGWTELTATGRVTLEPRPYWPDYPDTLRFQTMLFRDPDTVRGASYLSIWNNDQRKYPLLYAYLPELRRVRQIASNRRFEPLETGLELFLSDAFYVGDPTETWHGFRIVGRGPFLAGLAGNWHGDAPDWQGPVHGGPGGRTFWDTTVEFVPEAVVVEAAPSPIVDAPISKKRVWFDARNQLPLAMVTYDHDGRPLRSFEATYSLYESGAHCFMDGAHPYWSWTQITSSDLSNGRVSRIAQIPALSPTETSGANDPSVFNRYLTQSALNRLGTR